MNIILLAGILGLAQARPQQANIEPDSNGFYHMGDMMLSPGQYQEAYGETDKSVLQSGRKDDKYRWENKVLLYAFKPRSIVPENKDKVREVIERFNDEMSHCVQIKEAEEADEDFVTVQAGEGCSSNVGKLGGEQFLTLDDGCFSDGTIIHEFIHAFGFYHEQNRADRDKYVEIKEEFIKGNKEHNFKKRTNTLTFGLPYDGLSIMHYGSNYFSVDTHNPEKKTIISKMNEISTNELGKSKWLTDIDVQKLEKMYNCKSKPKQAVQFTDNGEECENKCEKDGESYNWCYKVSGSWDYCTPLELPPQCHPRNYKVLQENNRNKNFKTKFKQTKFFRDCVWEGPDHYRMKLPAGTQIPENAPPYQHCGAYYPGWLNGSHPIHPGEEKPGEICFVWYSDTCGSKTSITITNCDGYYVYNMTKVPYCEFRYCAE